MDDIIKGTQQKQDAHNEDYLKSIGLSSDQLPDQFEKEIQSEIQELDSEDPDAFTFTIQQAPRKPKVPGDQKKDLKNPPAKIAKRQRQRMTLSGQLIGSNGKIIPAPVQHGKAVFHNGKLVNMPMIPIIPAPVTHINSQYMTAGNFVVPAPVKVKPLPILQPGLKYIHPGGKVLGGKKIAGYKMSSPINTLPKSKTAVSKALIDSDSDSDEDTESSDKMT